MHTLLQLRAELIWESRQAGWQETILFGQCTNRIFPPKKLSLMGRYGWWTVVGLTWPTSTQPTLSSASLAVTVTTRTRHWQRNPLPVFPTFLSLMAMVCSMAATHGIRGMGCDALFLVEPALWSRMTLWLFSAISICNHHADQQKSASWLGISLCLDRRNVMWPPHDSDIPMT